MPIIGPTEEAKQFLASEYTDGPVETHLNENAEAGWTHSRKNLLWGSRAMQINSAFDDIWDENAKRLVALGVDVPNRLELFDAQKDAEETGGVFGGVSYLEKHRAQVEEWKKKDPNVLNIDEMGKLARERAIADSQEARAEFNDIYSRSSLGGSIGGMIGIGAGVMTDPINIGAAIVTAPIALESLGAAILGNALINTASETAVQYLPGGVRDWGREQGLTDEELNTETLMSIGGAAAGGAVLGGALKGGQKIIQKVFSKNPMESRNAVNSLVNNPSTPPEVKDLLDVIKSAKDLEDSAAFNVLNTKFSNIDGEQLMTNLARYQEVAKSIVNDAYEGNGKAFTPENIEVLRTRANDINNILKEIDEGIDVDTLDDVLKTFLSEERYARYQDLVEHYKGEGSNKLAGLSRAENVIRNAEDWKADIEQSAKGAVEQFNKMKEIQAQKAKELADADAILDDLQKKKAKVEKEVVDLHDGKWGQIDDITRNQIHDDLMARVKEAEAEMADFTKERNRIADDLEAFNKKVAKAERRANRDINSKMDDVERDKMNELDIAREEANRASKAEVYAAREVLTESKWIEENKIAYAEFFAMHPTADAGRLRELVAMTELRNRLRDGDSVTLDDFKAILNDEQAARFEKVVDKTNSLEEAASKFVDGEKKALGKEGAQRLESIAKNVNEIIERFGEDVKVDAYVKWAKDIGSKVRGIDVDQATKAVRAFVDGDMQAKLDEFISQNINTKVVDPDTGQLVDMSDIMKELDELDTLATLIESCKA